MALTVPSRRLDRPVSPADDHILGEPDAEITLVEYGSYACPHCRAANERITQLRDRFGDRLRYVFRHRPLPGSDLARRAAELAEGAPDTDAFWRAHVALMTRSERLTEEDLQAVAADLGVPVPGAAERVDADTASAAASGVVVTPTFFVNGRRYEGLWETGDLASAMEDSLPHRLGAAAVDFARWAPSAGVLLLVAAVLAVVLTNSPLGPGFLAFWQTPVGLTAGDSAFRLPLLSWINDGLLSVFFLVVGLEIKREFTVGHLSSRRSAAFPVAAAIGGMAVPALLYLAIVPAGTWARGWGVPIATDTAFAVALIVMLGRRVPVELRVFLTASAIVDDIGAILVVALFYATELHAGYLVAAALLTGLLALLNRAGVYKLAPYVLLGVVLWALVHEGGVHATLAGVLLALVIPTRPPPDLRAIMSQANAILQAEAEHAGEVLRSGPSQPAIRAMDALHARLESPADRLLRLASLRSNYVVLPVFALANAGVVLSAEVLRGHGALVAALVAGLVVGKPVGYFAAAALAVRLRLATKPEAYSWAQLAGAGVMAGIGFTMSLFIASQAFPAASDFAAAKIAVYAASVIAGTLGIAILWRAGRVPAEEAA